LFLLWKGGLGMEARVEMVLGRTPEALEGVDGEFDLLFTDPPYNSKRK